MFSFYFEIRFHELSRPARIFLWIPGRPWICSLPAKLSEYLKLQVCAPRLHFRHVYFSVWPQSGPTHSPQWNHTICSLLLPSVNSSGLWGPQPPSTVPEHISEWHLCPHIVIHLFMDFLPSYKLWISWELSTSAIPTFITVVRKEKSLLPPPINEQNWGLFASC